VPNICRYFKFRVGNSIVLVGDDCDDIEACLRMEGLIKCSIIPPGKSYYPILPFRCDNKHMFCLCRTCVLTTVEECVHARDEDRAITAMWVMDEVGLALD